MLIFFLSTSHGVARAIAFHMLLFSMVFSN